MGFDTGVGNWSSESFLFPPAIPGGGRGGRNRESRSQVREDGRGCCIGRAEESALTPHDKDENLRIAATQRILGKHHIQLRMPAHCRTFR